MLSFLWKQDTFLAVYCTLLSNSFLAIYLLKTTTQKTEKKKKKEGKKEFGRTRTQHHRLDATTPQHYTTETGKSPFPWNFRRQDDRQPH